ncbi:MAG: hypothetical protein MJ016_04270 [Victivallaceae bacterium]|nr:hypothetical protein [Victivallaceae bacterium]
MKRFFSTFCAAALTVICFCGCEAFQEALKDSAEVGNDNPNAENYEPRFILGVFSIVEYPRASSTEREIESLDGRKIWINTHQAFSSKYLRDVRVIARPGDPDVCDLQLRLDRTGKLQWEMLAGRFRDTPVVLAVDGRYLAKFIPEWPDDDDQASNWVTLRIGIDPYTAKGIAKYAKKNYYYYNPDAASWWNF